MRILTVVGNRPQFIKAAALSGKLRERHEEVLLHTGQHYDDSLSRVFFEELGLGKPDRELGIAAPTNSSQTAGMLAALEPVIQEVSPHTVLVYGDTNSTLAGALAGAQAGRPVIHVEAGMRSFEPALPEELNRVLVDHMASVLLCSSQTAAQNLRAEGLGARTGARVHVVGDVMVDVALRWQEIAKANGAALEAYNLDPQRYVLLTAHRAANVDSPERLQALVELVRVLAQGDSLGDVVFPVHPRTRERLRAAGLEAPLRQLEGVQLTDPLPYAAFSSLLCHARAVLTDSGGVQKEAYLAGVPCLTLRETTEWVETVQSGWNTLVDLDSDAVLRALRSASPRERPPLYGDGHAAARCVEAIDAFARELGQEPRSRGPSAPRSSGSAP